MISFSDYYWMRFKWNVIKDDIYYEMLDKFRKQLEEKFKCEIRIMKDRFLVVYKDWKGGSELYTESCLNNYWKDKDKL